METIQLQCGNCKQLMAIGVEYLGGQVQCPHCQAVVQTPASADAAPSTMPKMELEGRESIFAGPEASDSVLGDPPGPQAEMPSAPLPVEDAPTAAAEPGAEQEFAKFKSRPVYTGSTLQIVALIFLVPYAAVMTGFVIYLLMNQSRQDPYEFLRDPVPNPKGGGAKSVTVKTIVHTRTLAANLRTTLGKPIKIGDLLVTPQHVRLTAEGDLQLILKAQNLSTNTAFEPMHDRFANPKNGEPYTYLESNSNDGGKIFGAFLSYHKSADAKDDPRPDAVLNPRQETIILLETPPESREKYVARFAKSKDSLTWRVQVRRGFVKVDGKDVSATAIIGVDFSSGDIERTKS